MPFKIYTLMPNLFVQSCKSFFFINDWHRFSWELIFSHLKSCAHPVGNAIAKGLFKEWKLLKPFRYNKDPS